VDSVRKPGVRFARSLPALLMTVRREIAELRRETCARSREDPMRTRAGSEGRARRPESRRSSGSAIAAEALKNNAG
jgi:hypothetical protein